MWQHNRSSLLTYSTAVCLLIPSHRSKPYHSVFIKLYGMLKTFPLCLTKIAFTLCALGITWVPLNHKYVAYKTNSYSKKGLKTGNFELSLELISLHIFKTRPNINNKCSVIILNPTLYWRVDFSLKKYYVNLLTPSWATFILFTYIVSSTYSMVDAVVNCTFFSFV